MSSSLEGKTDMIAPKQSWHKQRAVIEFLLLEGETTQNISRKLKKVYGDSAIDYKTVTSLNESYKVNSTTVESHNKN